MDITTELQRCQDLWFEDGTVVLQAENTLFRVYTGILSRHSPFFRNLFTLPQPEDADKYEGCPLVLLAGDSAQDVHDFLLALHDVDYPQSLLDDAFFLAALLELSAKYEVASLRQRVVKILLPLFPTSLPAYDALAERMKQDRFKHPFKLAPPLVALARALEHAAPALLPYALLRLQRCADSESGFGYVVDGVEGRGGKRIYLSLNLQRAVLRGRSGLCRVSRTVVFPRMFSSNLCILFDGCDSARLAVIAKYMKADGYLDPFTKRPFKSFCPDCRKMLEDDAEVGRLKAWEQLPEIFGLPGWQELGRMTFEIET